MIYRYVRLVNLLLLAGICVLGLIVYRQWEEFTPPAPSLEAAHPVPGRVNPDPLPSAGLFSSFPPRKFDFYAQVVDLDLFRQDRRKPEEQLALAEEPQKPPEAFDRRFKLFGVAVAGKEKYALLSFYDQDPQTRQIKQVNRMVQEGQKIRDFTVERVETDYLVLSVREEKVEVHLNQPEATRPSGRR